jgi:hypothetical protein
VLPRRRGGTYALRRWRKRRHLMGRPAARHTAPQRSTRTILSSICALLAELRSILKGTVLPDHFVVRFRGQAAAGEPDAIGWFDTFGVYLAEQAKENERFYKILTVDLLGDLKRIGRDIRDLVDALNEIAAGVAAGVERVESARRGWRPSRSGSKPRRISTPSC